MCILLLKGKYELCDLSRVPCFVCSHFTLFSIYLDERGRFKLTFGRASETSE